MNKPTGPAIRRRDFAFLSGTLLTGAASQRAAFAAEPGVEADAANFVAGPGVNEPVALAGVPAALVRSVHEAALLRIPHLYAQAIDRRDRQALDNLFTQDAVFWKHDGDKRDRAGILNIPTVLSRTFTGTFHAVFNQTVVVKGRTAVGEVYCLARHFYPEREGRYFAHDMTFRYQDQYRLDDDHCWRFSLRHPILVADEPMNEIEPPLKPRAK